jgi:fatty acid desaturase
MIRDMIRLRRGLAFTSIFASLDRWRCLQVDSSSMADVTVRPVEGAPACGRGQETAIQQIPKLSIEERRELLTTRNDIPLRDFFATLALVFLSPILMAIYPSVPMGIVCALVNLHTFSRFANIVHCSGHSCLLADKRWEPHVGRISGYFLGYVREGHHDAHDAHHLYLNTARDGDRAFCEPEAKFDTVLRGLVYDFLLVTAIRRFLQYIPGNGKKNGSALAMVKEAGLALPKLLPLFASAAFFQLALLSAYVIAGHFSIWVGLQYYLLLYILPLCILYPAMIRLRSNVEHSFVPGYRYSTQQERRVVRSTKPNLFEKFIFAPLNIEYHYEHHLLPAMPYYNAPKLRRLLEDKGFSIPIAKGYVSFMWRKWLAERDLARNGDAQAS